MRKPILILTLCIFTSLAAVTPASAASAATCNNAKTIKISGNVNDISSLVKEALAKKSNIKLSKATKVKPSKKVVKAVKSKKNCNTKVTKKKSTKAKKTKKTKPSTSTTTNKKPSTNTSTSTKPATTNVNSNYDAFQKEVVRLVNKERAAAGLKALTQKSELDKVAIAKSKDMAKNNYFSHTSPTYGSPFDMLKQFGVKYSAAGENIAYGQKTPEEVMNGWMNSPGHRANILNANFTQIGVGVAKKSNGQLVWTQTFTRP